MVCVYCVSHAPALLMLEIPWYEGQFVGGIGCATLLGAALWWVTPFRPWLAALLAMLITLLGFAGGLTRSAIKRDRGVKDYGAVIPGHGGMLDGVDGVCVRGEPAARAILRLAAQVTRCDHQVTPTADASGERSRRLSDPTAS
jgi:predicted CDP-diglyceride synthetase/phosphatidate cytidylyltransferase